MCVHDLREPFERETSRIGLAPTKSCWARPICAREILHTAAWIISAGTIGAVEEPVPRLSTKSATAEAVTPDRHRAPSSVALPRAQVYIESAVVGASVDRAEGPVRARCAM